MVGAIASLQVKDLVPQRRKIIADIRDETVEWLDKQGYPVLPSEANMIMVDVRRPGRAFGQAMLEEKVAIGRTWPCCPITCESRSALARRWPSSGRRSPG